MPLIIYLLLLIIGAFIYFRLPAKIQLILCLINSALPDPIPYLDEIIMWGGFILKAHEFWPKNIKIFSKK